MEEINLNAEDWNDWQERDTRPRNLRK